jgi:hypothetical protein
MIQEEMFPIQRGKSIILNGQRIKAYDIRTITLEQFRMLIACGNDRHNNQIRVTKSGMVYLSEDIVGSEQLDDVALCFETFSAHNGYVGVKAAEDNSHVIPLYYYSVLEVPVQIFEDVFLNVQVQKRRRSGLR